MYVHFTKTNIRSYRWGVEFDGRSLLVIRIDWRKVNNMLKEPKKRTEKVFEEYNDYHDRGAGEVGDSVRNGRTSKVYFFRKRGVREGCSDPASDEPFEMDQP